MYVRNPVSKCGSFSKLNGVIIKQQEFHKQTWELFPDSQRKSTCLEKPGKSEAFCMPIRDDQPHSPIAPTQSFPSAFTYCLIKDSVWCSDKLERSLPTRLFALSMPAHIWEVKHQLHSNTKGSFHCGTEDSEPLISLTFNNFHFIILQSYALAWTSPFS